MVCFGVRSLSKWIVATIRWVSSHRVMKVQNARLTAGPPIQPLALMVVTTIGFLPRSIEPQRGWWRPFLATSHPGTQFSAHAFANLRGIAYVNHKV